MHLIIKSHFTHKEHTKSQATHNPIDTQTQAAHRHVHSYQIEMQRLTQKIVTQTQTYNDKNTSRHTLKGMTQPRAKVGCVSPHGTIWRAPPIKNSPCVWTLALFWTRSLSNRHNTHYGQSAPTTTSQLQRP